MPDEKPDLTAVDTDDLVAELRSRCSAIVIISIPYSIQRTTGESVSNIKYFGGFYTCLGLAQELIYSMTAQITRPESPG